MFRDSRSKRIIFVAHCVLNQNAKIDRCARYPGAMRELAEVLVESGVGIVQMPCPELMHLGLDRQAGPRLPSTIESEDTRVALLMRAGEAVSVCRRLAEDVVCQVRQYQRNGFEVLGLIGINGSPTCGVETNWFENEEASGPGVFIAALEERLQRDGVKLPAHGVKAADPQAAVRAAERLIHPPAGADSA